MRAVKDPDVLDEDGRRTLLRIQRRYPDDDRGDGTSCKSEQSATAGGSPHGSSALHIIALREVCSAKRDALPPSTQGQPIDKRKGGQSEIDSRSRPVGIID